MITKQNSGGRWAAWIGSDDGTESKHAVFGYATEGEAIAACNAKTCPALVRYVGPLAAYRGAIGLAAEGGAIIGGRLRLGDVCTPTYRLWRDDTGLVTRSTWDDACIALAHATGEPVDRSPPDPAGLVVTVGEHVYRLEVV